MITMIQNVDMLPPKDRHSDHKKWTHDSKQIYKEFMQAHLSSRPIARSIRPVTTVTTPITVIQVTIAPTIWYIVSIIFVSVRTY